MGGFRGVLRGAQQIPAPPPQHPPTQQEESVVLIAGRVLLRLEQRVEIPEGALHKIIRAHLREPGGHLCLRMGGGLCPLLPEPPQAPHHSPHLQEDLAQLRAHLEQGVQVAAGRGQPQRGEVVGFEGQLAPGTSAGGVRGSQNDQAKVTEGPGGSGRGRTWRSSPGSAPSPAAPRPC